MCGIVGYIGSRPARGIVINGLKRLEYRGYDSAGIAISDGERTEIFKCAGRVRDLEEMVLGKDFDGSVAMGHTRWATHGEPNEINAHPQVSYRGHFIVVHNGIIENYSRIKRHLESRDVRFTSQTDTEVLANLMEHLYLEGDLSAEQAVIMALNKVEGTYGIAVYCRDEPGKLFAARLGSPLVIGVGDGENFIASDATPIVEHTQRVIYLNDDDLAVIRKGKVIAVVTEGDEVISRMADYVLEVPDIATVFAPVLAVVPLQLLSYHIAVLRGCDVDQPRNLAKSVTVE